MGTKGQQETYLRGCHFMINLDEDSNSCSWPFFYGDETVGNGHKHYNGFVLRSMADSFQPYDKDVLRKTILKHEAVFKSQVNELHYLYRIQCNLMDELRRKESSRSRIAIEASVTSTPYEDAHRSQMPGRPLEKTQPVFLRTSISEVEDINHSILTSRKGSNFQAAPLPSQKGYNSKDDRVLEDRPVKVRRKLIDLDLPADAYIDPEEKTEIKDDIVSDRSNESLKKEAQRHSLRPSLSLKSKNCLADLNEPVDIQENDTIAYGSSHVLRNREIRGLEQSDGRNTESVGLSKKTSPNSFLNREPLHINFPHSEEIGSRRGWPPQVLGTGNYTGSQKSASLFLQPEKSPHSSHSILVRSNNLHERHGVVNAIDICSWKEREFIDLEANPKNGGIIRESYSENPKNSLARKSVSAQVHPFLNSPEKLSDNDQRVGRFGDGQHSENISRMNSVVSSICYNQKGFDYGSSSFSRYYLSNRPWIGYNYQNDGNDYDISPENFKNHFFKDSNRRETKSARDLNLNVEFSKDSVDEARNIGEPGSLPWLQPKPICKSKTVRHRDLNASYLSSSVANLDDSLKTLDHVLSQSLKSVYSSDNVEPRKIEANGCSANRKVIGCTISDKTSYKDRVASPKVDLNRVLDINLPSEPAFPASEEDLSINNRADQKFVASFSHQIDLNISICEDEDSFTPLFARSDVNVPKIDLEVSAVNEIEEFDVCGENSPERSSEKVNRSLDELFQMAAEAMVAFSFSAHNSDSDEVACSSQQASGNFLYLFSETIDSYGENLDKNLEAFSINKVDEINRDLTSLEGMDHFESMVLKLTEMKEEEYMPRPMIPENLKLDETGLSFLPTQRPRRGSARRGRPRRDFQRDILPGLVSLSRHEVTEDIQAFGGLMKATGYDWNAGLARRKSGSKRGRAKLVMASTNQSIPSPQNLVYQNPPPQQLDNNIKTGLEDRSSITGWGNMTRRPRRQRCPPGNNRTHVPLT